MYENKTYRAGGFIYPSSQYKSGNDMAKENEKKNVELKVRTVKEIPEKVYTNKFLTELAPVYNAEKAGAILEIELENNTQAYSRVKKLKEANIEAVRRGNKVFVTRGKTELVA